MNNIMCKKGSNILAIMLTLIMLFSIVTPISYAYEVENPQDDTYWTDNLTEKPEGFVIDENEPNNITINSAEGLAWLAVLTSGINGQSADTFEGKTIILSKDIDLSGRLWIPIGKYTRKKGKKIYNEFRGSFDGDNHVISNIKITTIPTDFNTRCYGLFGCVQEGVVKNVHLKDSFIDVTNARCTGGILGGEISDSVVENCTATGNLSGEGNIAGLIYNAEGTIITRCAFQGEISSKSCAYGLVGGTFDGTIEQCYLNVKITSDSNANGICGGLKENGSISNCYTVGSIEAGSYAGGICGEMPIIENNTKVENCYSTMSVKGKQRTGGILQRIEYGEVEGCVALNDILVSQKGEYVGRICGANYDEQSNAKKNFAYKGMKTYSKDEEDGETLYLRGLNSDECIASENQGEDITSEQLREGWPVKDWDETIWEFEAGKLPTLKNISGKLIEQAGEIPEYINPDSEKDWEITAFDGINIDTPTITLGTSVDEASSVLPQKLYAIKDNETNVWIPEIKWQSTDYNETSVGQYNFTPIIPEGYALNAELPVVKVDVVLKHKVSFETKGANEIEPMSIDNGELMSRPDEPIREGFIFEGWYKDEEYNNVWDFDTEIVTEAIMLHAKWSIAGNADYIASTEGDQTLDVSEMDFNNAELLKISNTGGYTTYAVVDEQKIDFFVPAGNYVIAQSGDTVESLSDLFKNNGNEIRQTKGQTPEEEKYKGRDRGTKEEPLTILANFFTKDASQFTEEADSVGLTFRILSIIAGYDTEGITNKGTTYFVEVEDRDISTGRLNASFTIDGSRLQPCYAAGWFRSPRTYGIAFNPSDKLIEEQFDKHTLYLSKDYAERREEALKILQDVREDEKTVLMQHTQMRDFPGPVTFKLDVRGYFDDGEKINVNYLLGGGNNSLYHGIKVSEDYTLALEPTFIKNNTSVVVTDGYVTIDLYNGGYFELIRAEDDNKETKYVAEFITNKNTDREIYPSTVYPQIVDGDYKVVKPEEPTKEGYKFDGWYMDNERNTPFDFNKELTDDIIIYAKWISNSGDTGGEPGDDTGGEIVGEAYTVEFVTGKTISGDNAAQIPSQKVKEGERAENPEKDSSICPFGFYDRGDGYLVLDWYTDQDLKNKFRFSTSIQKDTKLYPKYQRYILKDDGKADSGSGSKSNPKCVKLGDTKQSKVAWKFLNDLASGKLSGYYKVYVEDDNKGDELFSWTFNGGSLKKCNIAQPYYIYIDTHKVGNTIELELVNRTAIEGKATISVDVSKYIKKDCEVEVEYKDGTCDGMVAHSNVESGDWVQSHHKPKTYFTKTTADVEDGYVTFDISHGGTYIIKSDQIEADDASEIDANDTDTKVIEKEKIKAGEKINTSKLNQIIKDKKLLLVESEQGTALFDSKAIQAIKDGIMGTVQVNLDLIKNVKLSEKQKEKAAKKIENRPVYELEVKTGNKNISEFGGGKVIVTLPYTLKETEKPSGLVIWYLNDNGELIDMPCVYDSKKKEVSFTTTHFSYYVVGYDKNLEWDNPFNDVKQSDWFYRSVAYINKQGLMSGVSNNQFKPNGKTTRAMLVTILYRNEGEPKIQSSVKFKDVKESKWYTDAISWAVKNNIITGYNDIAFGTNDPVTREQLVAILYRYANMKKMSTTEKGQLTSFADAKLVSSWATEGLSWAVKEEIINGKGNNKLDPKGKATRAEVATVIEKVLKNQEEQKTN